MWREQTRRHVLAATATGVGVLAGCSASEPTTTRSRVPATTWLEEYDTVEIRVEDTSSSRLGTVTAAIADTASLRYQGLSGVASLPPDNGMLFVYGREAQRTFVMRGMEIGIDIVYADADGTVTSIHHAPAPGPNEDGNDQRYPGYGQYVLELPYRWTDERGVETGHSLLWEERLTPRA